MKLLESEWIRLRDHVIPKDAGSVQLQEMQRAFYAGAWAFYSSLMMTPDSVEDLELRVSSIKAEIREFFGVDPPTKERVM